MVTKIGRKLRMSDAEFASRFENQTLKPNMFDHHGHLRLAFYYLKNYSLEDATNRICESIHNYASHWGETDKFKRDLTIQIMHILHDTFSAQNYHSLEAFLEANPTILTDMKSVIQSK